MDNKEVSGIAVEYQDGTVKKLKAGCVVDLEDQETTLAIDMLEVKPVDIVRLAYGLIVTVKRMGMEEVLFEMLSE